MSVMYCVSRSLSDASVSGSNLDPWSVTSGGANQSESGARRLWAAHRSAWLFGPWRQRHNREGVRERGTERDRQGHRSGNSGVESNPKRASRANNAHGIVVITLELLDWVANQGNQNRSMLAHQRETRRTRQDAYCILTCRYELLKAATPCRLLPWPAQPPRSSSGTLYRERRVRGWIITSVKSPACASTGGGGRSLFRISG